MDGICSFELRTNLIRFITNVYVILFPLETLVIWSLVFLSPPFFLPCPSSVGFISGQ